MDTPLYLEPMQTRDEPPSPYEAKLAGLIQTVFAEGPDGNVELGDLIRALNDRGSTAPDGSAWTEDSFRTELNRLGA